MADTRTEEQKREDTHWARLENSWGPEAAYNEMLDDLSGISNPDPDCEE